jgi:hypothetical protein
VAIDAPAQRERDAQLFAQSGTLWTIQSDGLNLSTVSSASPLPTVPILPPRWRSFHEISRAEGPPIQSGVCVSQGWNGVRKAAKDRKQERFTALLHHVTVGLLRDSFFALKRQASPGVDGVTWQEYETGLEDRLIDLHSRVHRGAYRAQPSRRVYIPKPDGRQRPLGIAALEDKIVQQAVVTILNQMYEVDFQGFSYGLRPGRSPHQALDALYVGIQRKRVNWVLDETMKFVEHRVADRRMLRLIQKWLKAGVSEDGQWSETTVGTPQGAVVSPLLANVYLHYVFDLWVEAWRKKWHGAMSLSSAMPMIWWWAFNTGLTPSGSCKSFGNGWLSSVWSYMRTRHD